MITGPCMLFGDLNASTQGGRLNYAPAHANNPTTIADQAFAEFVEVTKGTIIPSAQTTWKNPFGGIKGQGAKLDFGIVYREQCGMDQSLKRPCSGKFYRWRHHMG